MKISVSFLKSDFNLDSTIKKINDTNADFIHVDIMDGKFIPYEANNNLEFLIENLKKTHLKIDIHLMVLNPSLYIEKLSVLNPEYITIHSEIDNVNYYLDLIKSKGIKTGIAINPETDIKTIDKYQTDLVLLMGVNPGLGGQKMNLDVIKKVDYIKSKNILAGIDGGVNDKTIEYLKNFDIIVAGSYICCSNNFQVRIDSLR